MTTFGYPTYSPFLWFLIVPCLSSCSDGVTSTVLWKGFSSPVTFLWCAVPVDQELGWDFRISSQQLRVAPGTVRYQLWESTSAPVSRSSIQDHFLSCHIAYQLAWHLVLTQVQICRHRKAMAGQRWYNFCIARYMTLFALWLRYSFKFTSKVVVVRPSRLFESLSSKLGFSL